MSEIKHQFTGGKMNKDLDERLVPNGEYRHAVNVQVSTSEGSDVGAVQNILGNELGCNESISIPANAKTIGSISDEKNDSFYWFVRGELGPPTLNEPYYTKDLIINSVAGVCKPVVVDIWSASVLNKDADGNFVSQENNNNVYVEDMDFVDQVMVGMQVHGFSSDTGASTPQATVLNVGNLSKINTTFSTGFYSSASFPVTQDSPIPVVRFSAIRDNAGNVSYPDNIIFVQNASSIRGGGLFVGDVITSGMDYYGNYALYSHVVTGLLGNGLYVVDSPFIAATPAPGSEDTLTTTTIAGNDGVTYLPFYRGVMGSMGSLIVDRANSIANNTIIFPPTSPWIDEIYSLKWDITENGDINNPYNLSPLHGALAFEANLQFPDGGCIDLDSIIAPIGGAYLYSFLVVECLNQSVVVNSLIANSTGQMILVTNIGGGFGNQIFLDRDLDLTAGFEQLVFQRPKVLNFPSNVSGQQEMITGVNIIDDMLLWVDGRYDANGEIIGSEPKKINIKRSIKGTESDGNSRTVFLKDNITLLGPYLKEEHIVVIRQSPKAKLSVEISTSRDPEKNYSGIISISGSDEDGVPNTSSFTDSDNNRRDFQGLKAGDSFKTTIDSDIEGSTVFDLDWTVGTKVVLKEFDEEIAPAIPFSENSYRIKGVVEKWKNASGSLSNFSSINGPVKVSIRIISIDGFPPRTQTNLKYAIDFSDESEKLFEFKFPRFSYRYKYIDGEYSSYAPFTEVAFSPGQFAYHPTIGYNTGMTNTIEAIKLKGFTSQDIPDDVVAIDLLYKDDAKTGIYIVDTLRENDEVPAGQYFNDWYNNYFTITSETITSIVPENQLLRPYDNVPRKAVSQEITGNRLVYGNYLQNYNLTAGSKDYYPVFESYLTNSPRTNTGSSKQSIKSLREYQLGVVFTDKYGRETPVISNKTGSFTVPKSDASKSNSLSISLVGETPPPPGLEYFKFYIKESSGEYYNMAMDRYFEAEDGNYWISFPSTERNKIDEDSFLVLKKGSESDTLVRDKARYKVLAISSEAPEFIKTSHYNVGQVTQRNSEVFASAENAPTEGKDYFNCLNGRFEAGSANNIQEITDPLYVEFSLQGTDLTSNRYRITNIEKGDTDFFIKIDGTFKEDVNFIQTTKAQIKEGTIIKFFKYVVESKPIFEGRFFVKLENNAVFSQNVAKPEPIDQEYIVTAEKKVYFMSEHHVARHARSSTADFTDSSAGTSDFGANANINEDYCNNAGAASLDYKASIGNFHATYDVSYAADNVEHEHGTHWASYEAYFKNKFFDVSSKFGSYHTKHRGPKDNDIFEDVMFIDHGPHVGNHGHRGAFRFNDMNSNHHSQGIGVVNYNDIGRMDLSFGSIEPEENKGKSNDVNNFTQVESWDEDWEKGGTGEGFWDLTGQERTKYNDLKPIYNKITSGSQFRWKEDPTGTIYTITQQVDNYNVARFSNGTKDKFFYNIATGVAALSGPSHFQQLFGSGDPPTEDSSGRGYYKDIGSNGLLNDNSIGESNLGGETDIQGGTPYTMSSNFQQKKRFWFTPAMTSWDPTEQDSLGTISGGSKVDSTVVSYDAIDGSPDAFNTLQGAQVTENIMTMTVSDVENAYDSVNAILIDGLEGMILTSVGGSALGNPLLVSEVESIPGGTTHYAIKFKGYSTNNVDLNDSFSAPLTYEDVVFEQPSMNGLSVNSAKNISDYNAGPSVAAGMGAVGYTMQFVIPKEEENRLSANPAIWETEPKESADVDIYYEISGRNPVKLNASTIKTALPIGSKVSFGGSNYGQGSEGLFVQANSSINGDTIVLSELLCTNIGGCGLDNDGNYVSEITVGTFMDIEKPDGVKLSVEIKNIPSSGYSARVFEITTDLYNVAHTMDWHNCYSFGNGVESNRIRDTFNKPFITNGVKASTTFDGDYKQEHRKYGLIYSGIYNSNSGVNNLNQFIQAESITKDINPIYGSIQKLHSRSTADGDLIVLCEDRVLKILANKDALFNADGNLQLTATNNVLGQAIPFSGSYGISRNPESFASESYRVYFTDKVRGAVMRLSKDGLTPISDAGMKDWFRDNLKLNQYLVGSYDDRKNEYNLTLATTNDLSLVGGTTVSFKEDVKGWVSFKSFVPQNAISCANEYYTFANGRLWKQNVLVLDNNVEINRNTFYNDFTPSSLKVILNESPGSIKTFHALNYEGTQSKVKTFTDYDTYLPGTTISTTSNVGIYNNEYYNLQDKKGWSVQNIITDQEEGSLNEFIEKEGKWFNYIKGKAGTVSDGSNTYNFDNADFAFQGLGVIAEAATTISYAGCTSNGDNLNGAGIVYDEFGLGVPAFNYDENAIQQDSPSTCIETLAGCMDPACVHPAGSGYNVAYNVDDGGCIYYGCMEPNATNYDINATNSSYLYPCVFPTYGCTDGSQDANGMPIFANYDVSATNDCNGTDGNHPNFTPIPCYDGQTGPNCCCVTIVYGCMDSNADNYDVMANTQTTSSIDPTNPCFYTVLGCTDPTSCVYDSNANTDDGTCHFCNDPLANNYDGLAPDGDPYQCNDGCEFCKRVDNLIEIPGNPAAIDIEWDHTGLGAGNIAQVNYYEIIYNITGGDGVTGSGVVTNIMPITGATSSTYSLAIGVTGEPLLPETGYTIEVRAVCIAGTSLLNPSHFTSSDYNLIPLTVTTPFLLIQGCMEEYSCNYNSLANDQMWSNANCDFSCIGCTDPLADNYDATATVDDGSECIYPVGCTDAGYYNTDSTPGMVNDPALCEVFVYGCMDNSLANDASTIAATNYNVGCLDNFNVNVGCGVGFDTPLAVNVGVNSCIYELPIEYADTPNLPWNNLASALLNTPGWMASGLWGGTNRVLWAVWDISLSPKIAGTPDFATELEVHPTGTSNVITTYLPHNLNNWQYSNNGGNSWNTGTNWDGAEAIHLVRFRFQDSGAVAHVGNESFYPPQASSAYVKQGARFYWANTPQNNVWAMMQMDVSFTTTIAQYDVLLGCNDNTYMNYSPPGEAFADNTLCVGMM